ncbi:hypothetical protein GCM10025876_12310 [Demequina litorisediminis]|uniref:Uncharacterized protein n=1 Tax=Demequina litorisediminis TaxID=1849022 RepID=A0ABQ6ICX0_9MICO|nr:hypothetical protein GCM10025876_12310 [Demequina litorisediminis]
MEDDGLDGVALHVLGDGELFLAVELQREEGVGVLQRHHGGVAREDQVHGVGAVAVEDRGDLAGGTGAAGVALAEVGAGSGVENEPCQTWCLLEIRWWSQARQASTSHRRVDHVGVRQDPTSPWNPNSLPRVAYACPPGNARRCRDG